MEECEELESIIILVFFKVAYGKRDRYLLDWELTVEKMELRWYDLLELSETDAAGECFLLPLGLLLLVLGKSWIAEDEPAAPNMLTDPWVMDDDSACCCWLLLLFTSSITTRPNAWFLSIVNVVISILSKKNHLWICSRRSLMSSNIGGGRRKERTRGSWNRAEWRWCRPAWPRCFRDDLLASSWRFRPRNRHAHPHLLFLPNEIQLRSSTKRYD